MQRLCSDIDIKLVKELFFKNNLTPNRGHLPLTMTRKKEILWLFAILINLEKSALNFLLFLQEVEFRNYLIKRGEIRKAK